MAYGIWQSCFLIYSSTQWCMKGTTLALSWTHTNTRTHAHTHTHARALTHTHTFLSPSHSQMHHTRHLTTHTHLPTPPSHTTLPASLQQLCKHSSVWPPIGVGDQTVHISTGCLPSTEGPTSGHLEPNVNAVSQFTHLKARQTTTQCNQPMEPTSTQHQHSHPILLQQTFSSGPNMTNTHHISPLQCSNLSKAARSGGSLHWVIAGRLQSTWYMEWKANYTLDVLHQPGKRANLPSVHISL